MIPMESFALEHYHGDNGKDGKRDYFLDNLQLKERERTAITDEADAIAWHLKAIFEESQAPRKENYAYQRPTVGDVHFLKFQMTVPSESHEDVGTNKEEDCVESVHNLLFFSCFQSCQELNMFCQRI